MPRKLSFADCGIWLLLVLLILYDTHSFESWVNPVAGFMLSGDIDSI